MSFQVISLIALALVLALTGTYFTTKSLEKDQSEPKTVNQELIINPDKLPAKSPKAVRSKESIFSTNPSIVTGARLNPKKIKGLIIDPTLSAQQITESLKKVAENGANLVSLPLIFELGPQSKLVDLSQPGSYALDLPQTISQAHRLGLLVELRVMPAQSVRLPLEDKQAVEDSLISWLEGWQIKLKNYGIFAINLADSYDQLFTPPATAQDFITANARIARAQKTARGFGSKIGIGFAKLETNQDWVLDGFDYLTRSIYPTGINQTQLTGEFLDTVGEAIEVLKLHQKVNQISQIWLGPSGSLAGKTGNNLVGPKSDQILTTSQSNENAYLFELLERYGDQTDGVILFYNLSSVAIAGDPAQETLKQWYTQTND